MSRNENTSPFGSSADGRPPAQTTAPFNQTTAPFGQTTVPFGMTTAPFAAPPTSAAALPHYPPAHGQEELTLSDLGPLVRQFLVQIRARWIAGLIAAVLVTAGAGWLFFHSPTEFTAETTMLAQSPLDKILNPGSPNSADTSQLSQENSLRNHLSVMTSRTFLKKVADSLTPDEKKAVIADYPVKASQTIDEQVMDLLDAKIDIDRERGRDFFTIDVRHRVPDVAVMLAERFTSQYMDYVQSEYRDASMSATTILQKQADVLSAEMRKIEDQRREYRKSYNLISVEENQSIISERLRRINAALSDVRVLRVGYEIQLTQAKLDLANTPTPYNNSLLATFGNTPDLRSKLDAMKAQLEVMATEYGPNHPKIIEQQGVIAGLQRTINGNFQTALADLQGKYSLAVTSEKQLNEELTSAFNQSLDIDKLASSFNTLGDELAAKRKTQTELLSRIADAALGGQMPSNVMSVVDPAFQKQTSFKKQLLLGVLVLMLGLGAFVTTPVLLHLFDERLSASADLESVLGKELLGAVPRLTKTRDEDRPHLVRDNVDFASVEAFLSIVGQLDLISKKPMPRRLLVTSTLPGEGKSMAASNLAATYTRLGRRTLLVDLDFRRPTQSLLQQIGDGKGLLPFAVAGFPPELDRFQSGGSLGIVTLADGTFFLPAGGTDTQPTRHLISAGMAVLFEQLSSEFEVVIVDTPPAGVFQDALILAKYCHETILIARDGKAQTAQVQRVIGELDKTASPAVGVVLNGFAPGATHPHMAYRHLADKYGYGYGYGKDSKDGKKAKPAKSTSDDAKAATKAKPTVKAAATG